MKHLSVYKLCLWAMSSLLLLASAGLFMSPALQDTVQSALYPKARFVLASLETDLNVQGHMYKVLKIKTGKEIWIEIYNLKHEDAQVVSFKILAKADGQMFVNDKTSPLFASDLSGNGVLEIVAPTFSLGFQPQIRAFELNKLNGRFTKLPNNKLINLL